MSRIDGLGISFLIFVILIGFIKGPEFISLRSMPLRLGIAGSVLAVLVAWFLLR